MAGTILAPTEEQIEAVQMVAMLRGAQDAYRWREFAVVADLLALAPSARHKAFKRWAAVIISESARPVAPRTLERMAEAWTAVPEELRGLLDASKALLITMSFRDLSERVEWYHKAMTLSWPELTAALRSLGKPVRPDAEACPMCGRPVRAGKGEEEHKHG